MEYMFAGLVLPARASALHADTDENLTGGFDVAAADGQAPPSRLRELLWSQRIPTSLMIPQRQDQADPGNSYGSFFPRSSVMQLLAPMPDPQSAQVDEGLPTAATTGTGLGRVLCRQRRPVPDVQSPLQHQPHAQPRQPPRAADPSEHPDDASRVAGMIGDAGDLTEIDP